MDTFGARYLLAWAKWREEHPDAGESETAFANALKIPQGTLNPFKGRIDAPASWHVLTIARATGTDPGWLAFGKDSLAPMRREWPEGGEGGKAPPTPVPTSPPQRPFKEVSRHAKAPLHPIKPQDQGKGRKKA